MPEKYLGHSTLTLKSRRLYIPKKVVDELEVDDGDLIGFFKDGDEIKDDNYVTTSNFIFHPKVMGIIFVLLEAVFTIALLAGKSS